MLPSNSHQYGLYGIILLIVGFTGFVIGAAIQPTVPAPVPPETRPPAGTTA
jgi:hypothetical protein